MALGGFALHHTNARRRTQDTTPCFFPCSTVALRGLVPQPFSLHWNSRYVLSLDPHIPAVIPEACLAVA